jgi:glycerol-3-phosphate dehydrogenase subunit B
VSELELTPDVLVVGAGIAGAIAAARARERGAKVTLVWRPGGGTVSSSGAIDVADDLVGLVPGPALDPLERGGRWRRSADAIAARHVRHPYARLGDKGRERLREALSLLKQLAGAGGVELVERDDGQNHVVATQLGTVKRAALVQKSQLLDLAALEGDVLIGVVEPADLAGFSGRSVVHMLSWILGLSPGRRVQLTTIAVDRTLPDREVHGGPVEMASRLDEPAALGLFLEALRTAVRKLARTPALLLLPPVLGIEKSAAAFAEAERFLARPVRELLALPASAPGERLQGALLAGARRMGIQVLEGAAVKASVQDKRATGLVVEGPKMRVDFTPKTVVLAGGRFFGGGVVRDQVARASLFDLPIFTGGNLVGDAFIGEHTADTPEGDHAIFRAGVAVSEGLHPLDAAGRIILENVTCAGSLLEGWDPARDSSGGGVSALTGFVAGERAATVARAG